MSAATVQESGWVCYYADSLPPGCTGWIRVAHIVPNFGFAHVMLGDECFCKPRIEWFKNGNAMVVHNACGHLKLVPSRGLAQT